MSDDKCVPTVAEVRRIFSAHALKSDREKLSAEFDRFISKIRAEVWDVAYQQGRWDERTAQHIEKHPGDADRLGAHRDNPYRKDN